MSEIEDLRAERDEARAALARVEALCRPLDAHSIGQRWVHTNSIRAALAATGGEEA